MSKAHVAELAVSDVQVQGGLAGISRIKAELGTSGAVDNNTGTDPGWTLTKPSGTGLYRITGPKSANFTVLDCRLIMATYADRKVDVEEIDSGAGTIDIRTSAAGSAANGTDGDLVSVVVLWKRYNV